MAVIAARMGVTDDSFSPDYKDVVAKYPRLEMFDLLIFDGKLSNTSKNNASIAKLKSLVPKPPQWILDFFTQE